MQRWPLPLLTLCCLTLASCDSGSGVGLDENGRPLSEAAAQLPLTASLESLQVNLFTPNCAVSGCHSGAAAVLGLSLDAGASFANLVSRSSVQQPQKLRIKPGDSTNSYLVQKLEGAAGIGGEAMPRGRARLSQQLIDTLKLWIDNGASSIPSVATQPASVVSQITPSDKARIVALPASLSVEFSRAMDETTLVDLTLSLLSAGGDSGFSDGNELALIAQPTLSSDGRVLTLDLSANASVGDTSIEESYQFRIKGVGPAVARDRDNRLLDGDFDGLAGGDYVSSFRVGASDLLPVFSSLEADFFVPTCAKSGCHAGSFPAAGMNLEAGNAYSNIVNVSSVFAPSLLRINPGNADVSAIVQALEGSNTGIPQMPLDNQGSVPQDDIDVLRRWISDGANP